MIQDSLFGAMLYAASAPEKSVGGTELEKKWKFFLSSLTGWKPD